MLKKLLVAALVSMPLSLMAFPSTYVCKYPDKTVYSSISIDGYKFSGCQYIDAVNLWLNLYNSPGYVSRPPVTSVSVDVTISGTVNP